MKQRRSVAALNSGVALGLIVLLAVVALVVKPPAPPGIAEFAPQAAKPITKAPDSQAAAFGSGPGGSCVAAAQVCASASPAPKVSAVPVPSVSIQGVPSALQCYEWPDGKITQTFDPQSPPCVATWDDKAGNGGATAPGVTGSAIRIAVPMADPNSVADIQPLATFFSTTFQLYGRKIQLVPYSSATINGTGTPEEELADAKAASSLNVFGSLDFTYGTGSEDETGDATTYMTKLANKHILSVQSRSTYVRDSLMRANAPYMWAFQPQLESIQRALAAMVCTSLGHATATHAGDPDLRKPRTYAIARPNATATHGAAVPDVSLLHDALKGCGIDAPVYDYDTSDADTATMVGVASGLKSKGITTVITFSYSLSRFQAVADEAGYHPEWVVPGIQADESETYSATPSEAGSTFGLAPFNKKLGESEMAAQAYRQMQSGLDGNNRYLIRMYHQLLLLASGFQAAGPHLTPATFASGLHTLEFPNPEAGAPPSYQAAVGFQDGSYTMTKDFGGWWWSSSAAGVGSEQGSRAGGFCYIGKGLRFTDSTWPKQDRFFGPECR